MFKSFWQTALRFAALVLLLITLSYPVSAWAQDNSAPEIRTSQESETVGAQDNDATERQARPEAKQADQERAQQPTAARSYPKPPNVYDMEAIEKFDAELYGRGN